MEDNIPTIVKNKPSNVNVIEPDIDFSLNSNNFNPPKNSDTWILDTNQKNKLISLLCDWRSDDNISGLQIEIGEAILQYKYTFEPYNWIVPIYNEQNINYIAGIDYEGSLAWLMNTNVNFPPTTQSEAFSILNKNFDNSYYEPKLTYIDGKNYWMFQSKNNIEDYKLLDIYSQDISNFRFSGNSQNFDHLRPGAPSVTEIKPNLVPWFDQTQYGSPNAQVANWCGAYSTTMVLSWWGADMALQGDLNGDGDNNHHDWTYKISRITQANSDPDPVKGAHIGTLEYAVNDLIDDGVLPNFQTVWHGEMKPIDECDYSSNDINDLKSMIYNGNPVVIGIDLDGIAPFFRSDNKDLHVIVIVGYNDENNYVRVNDPGGGNKGWDGLYGWDARISYQQLEDVWGAWDDHWYYKGFPDADTPSDSNNMIEHTHKHIGFVLYPGDGQFKHPVPHAHVEDPGPLIEKGQTMNLRVSFQNVAPNVNDYEEAGTSGVNIWLDGGLIEGFTNAPSNPFDNYEAIDLNGNIMTFPSPGIKLIEHHLDQEEYLYGNIDIIPLSDQLTVKYRGWCTDIDDKTHSGYNLNNNNPWNWNDYQNDYFSVITDTPGSVLLRPLSVVVSR